MLSKDFFLPLFKVNVWHIQKINEWLVHIRMKHFHVVKCCILERGLAGQIHILVVMATYSSHGLIRGKFITSSLN